MSNDMFSQWAPLKHAIPAKWKKLIYDYSDINENNLYTKIITLSKELEFCPTANYPLRKYI